MTSTQTARGLFLALLAVAVLSATAAAVAGATPTDVAQTATETAGNQTDNSTAGNGTAEEATVGNLTVWTAPGERFGDLTSPAVFRSAMDEDWLTRAEPVPENASVSWSTLSEGPAVAENDTVAFAVEAPALSAAVASANETDSNATAFLRVLNRSSTYHFRMRQTEASTRPQARPKHLNLSDTLAADGLRVVPDERNDTLYVALRTDRTELDRGAYDAGPVRDWDAYAVNLTAGSGTDATAARAEWAVVERAVDFDTRAGVVARGGDLDCAPVAGETSVAPGTDLRFVLEPDHDGYEAWTTEATVNPAGRFFACANTTRVPQNVSLSVAVAGAPDATGHIAGGAYEPTTVTAEMAANGTVTVDVLSFRDGFVALYAVPDDAVGLTEWNRPPNCTWQSAIRTVANWTRVDASAHLEGGARTVQFEPPAAARSENLLAVTHLNSDADERLAFPGSDLPVCAMGTLEGDLVTPADDQGQTPTGNETASETGPTAASTVEAESSPEESTATETAPATTTAYGPGFGPAGPVAALAAVALLVLGRMRDGWER